MMDRHGANIVIGWPEHHLVWIRAALTLPVHSRTQAFKDIADLTGRSLGAIRTKAYWLKLDAAERARVEASRTRLILVADRGRGPYKPRQKLPPSTLSTPTKAQLMGAR